MFSKADNSAAWAVGLALVMFFICRRWWIRAGGAPLRA